MTAQAIEPIVRRSVTVAVSQQRAFDVFTRDFGSWWPKSHHIAPQDMATAIVEPRTGGRWFEKSIDGDECEWGRVLAYDPPRRVMLSWHLNHEWKYIADPSRASEVDVTFVAEGPNQTVVTLEHRNLDRHGAGWEIIRTGISQEAGWGGLLALYAAAATH